MVRRSAKSLLGPDLRARLEEILACPTAPFAEGAVHARIHAAVAASPRLREECDAFGNHLVTYGRGRPKLLFACHTDHPALRSEGRGRARVLGGIRAKALAGARLTAMDGRGARGRVARVLREMPDLTLRVRMSPPVPAGEPILLDLPARRVTARRISARAIDDLCAVACCLAMFDRLAAEGFPGCVGALFTRAEEVGFAGALAWVRSTRLPRSTTVVNLEMSNARSHTPQGHGPILRVGDRISTFDPQVLLELEEVARTLQERGKGFAWQRALMDGGSCEATVYTQAGFRTGALCLPLKNYHNHAPAGGVGMEYVDSGDAENLLRWMTAFARGFPARDPAARVRRRLDELWRKNRTPLRRSAREGRRRS